MCVCVCVCARACASVFARVCVVTDSFCLYAGESLKVTSSCLPCGRICHSCRQAESYPGGGARDSVKGRRCRDYIEKPRKWKCSSSLKETYFGTPLSVTWQRT